MLNYDKAVIKAREQKIPVVLGLASELAGVFYLSIGAAVTAKPHLTAAYQTYMVRTQFVPFASRRTVWIS